jgi:ADP-heptose:LPS heptosyltransferase
VRRLVDAACLSIFGGIGDHMILTTVARELKRRGQGRIFVISEYPDLFHRNPDVDGVAVPGSRLGRFLERLAGDRRLRPTYLIDYDPTTEERVQPPDPILAYMCRMSGITGRVDLRPYVTLSESERAWAAAYRGCVAVQSSGLGARFLMRNKQWPPARMTEVAAHLLRSHPVVQIGSAGDPAVPHTHDLRGKTTLRQLAGLLSQCRMFVGLVGMPMHMARAVDCPSVIVYGGRERPDQTGYICNENVYNAVPCAPCWLDSRCDFDRVCMETLPASAVIAAADRLLARPRDGLAVEAYEIR